MCAANTCAGLTLTAELLLFMATLCAWIPSVLSSGALPATAANNAIGTMIPIKMLNSPRSAFQPQQQQPVKTVPAKPPSGPSHLVTGLLGRCFATNIGQYEYRLCPFDNATQRDGSYHLLSGFHGVIGVWDGWQIDTSNASDSRLVAMAMPNGEPCPSQRGSRDSAPNWPQRRRTLVHLRCANASRLASVLESSVCNYRMLLETPLACPAGMADLAYSALPERYRLAWDALHSMRHRRTLNETSYQLLLTNLLFRANLLAESERLPSAASEVPATADSKTVVRPTHHSSSEVLPDSADRKPNIGSIVDQLIAMRKQMQKHSIEQSKLFNN